MKKMISVFLLLLVFLAGCNNANQSSNTPSPSNDVTFSPIPSDSPTDFITATPDPTEIPSTSAPTLINQPSQTARPSATVPKTTPYYSPAGKEIKPEDISYIVPPDLKSDYIIIKNSLLSMEDTVSITRYVTPSTIGSEIQKISSLIDLVKYTSPEIFYAGYSIEIRNTQISKPQNVTFNISFKDMLPKNEITEMKSTLDAKVSAIINEANQYPNDFEREIFIHDYLVKNIIYDGDESNKHSRSVYGGLVMGRGVCEAYARSFQLLMLKLGIETTLITGVALTNNQNHMWNIIKLSGKYYHVDVTWDDPVPDKDVKDEHSKYLIVHTYLNQTDALMCLQRSFGTEGYYMPFSGLVCDSMEMNYYNAKSLASGNSSELLGLMQTQKNSFPKDYKRCIELLLNFEATEAQVISIARKVFSNYYISYNTQTKVVRITDWK